jgi:hypothetical protein
MVGGQVRGGDNGGLCPQTPRIYRFAAKIGLDWGSEFNSLPTNLGPGVGARVASLRCPTLRPGHSAVYSNCRQAARGSSRILVHRPCKAATESNSAKGTGTR